MVAHFVNLLFFQGLRMALLVLQAGYPIAHFTIPRASVRRAAFSFSESLSQQSASSASRASFCAKSAQRRAARIRVDIHADPIEFALPPAFPTHPAWRANIAHSRYTYGRAPVAQLDRAVVS